MNDRRKSETERRNISARRSTGNVWMIGRTLVLLLDPIVTGKIQVVHFFALSQMVSDGPPNVGFGTNNNQGYKIKLYRSCSTEAYSKEFKRH